MTRMTLAALALLISAAVPTRAADGPVDEAKRLYLLASYDEALAALSSLPPSVDLDQVDKYRALCFLGLNRPQDAEEAINRLVTRRPLVKPDETDSPKLVMMYREARSRVIPGAAKSLFVAAKKNFENGEVTTASAQFHDVLALVADAEPMSDAALVDLKMLAEGFEKLAQNLLARDVAVSASKSAPAPAPTPAPIPEPVATPVAKIHDSNDVEVVPPVALVQTIPRWSPTADSLRIKTYTGALEIVVDETGAVTSARLTTPVNLMYDQLLLNATKRWRYQPAQKEGKPVKYRRLIAIVLTPST